MSGMLPTTGLANARIVTITFATGVVIRLWKVIVAGEQNEWIKKQQMLVHLLLLLVTRES